MAINFLKVQSVRCYYLIHYENQVPTVRTKCLMQDKITHIRDTKTELELNNTWFNTGIAGPGSIAERKI